MTDIISFGLPILVEGGASGVPTYRLLLPHFINGKFLDQGSIVQETVDLPPGWVPTLAVDPLNATAVNAYYVAGPRGLGWESLNLYGAENFIVTAMRKPVTYWVQASPGKYQLTGLGVGLAPVGS